MYVNMIPSREKNPFSPYANVVSQFFIQLLMNVMYVLVYSDAGSSADRQFLLMFSKLIKSFSVIFMFFFRPITVPATVIEIGTDFIGKSMKRFWLELRQHVKADIFTHYIAITKRDCSILLEKNYNCTINLLHGSLVVFSLFVFHNPRLWYSWLVITFP